jgi:hypothetical protein
MIILYQDKRMQDADPAVELTISIANSMIVGGDIRRERPAIMEHAGWVRSERAWRSVEFPEIVVRRVTTPLPGKRFDCSFCCHGSRNCNQISR